MPRWGAVKGFGDLQPDGALTQEEIIIIAAWVVGGAPNGDPRLLPKPGEAHALDRAPSYKHPVVVKIPAVLQNDISVAAIHPLGSALIGSERITAILPDGRVEPLVWLYQYDPKWDTTFTFRRPAQLPKGTRIESSGTLQLALEESIGSPPAQ